MRFRLFALGAVLLLAACQEAPPPQLAGVPSGPLFRCRTVTISGQLSCEQACNMSEGALCTGLSATVPPNSKTKTQLTPPTACEQQAGGVSVSCRCCRVD